MTTTGQVPSHEEAMWRAAHPGPGPEPTPGVKAVPAGSSIDPDRLRRALSGADPTGLLATHTDGWHAHIFPAVDTPPSVLASSSPRLRLRVDLYVAGVPFALDGLPEPPYVGRTFIFTLGTDDVTHLPALTSQLAALFLAGGAAALRSVREATCAGADLRELLHASLAAHAPARDTQP